MSGAGLGAPEHQGQSNRLMIAMEESTETRLVMDNGFIQLQYGEKLRGSFGEYWVRRLADLNRIDLVPRAKIDRGTNVALREAHFDREDYKYYVRTAASAVDRRLVTSDPNYSPSVKTILRKRLSIDVFSPGQACTYCSDP